MKVARWWCRSDRLEPAGAEQLRCGPHRATGAYATCWNRKPHCQWPCSISRSQQFVTTVAVSMHNGPISRLVAIAQTETVAADREFQRLLRCSSSTSMRGRTPRGERQLQPLPTTLSNFGAATLSTFLFVVPTPMEEEVSIDHRVGIMAQAAGAGRSGGEGWLRLSAAHRPRAVLSMRLVRGECGLAVT